jgi:hypothetical protein
MYSVPESKRSLKQNQFEFTTDGKNSFSIPKVQYLSLDFIEKASKHSSGVQIVDICVELGNDAAVAALKVLDGEQLGELAVAWMEASGASTGESSASTD